MSRKDSITQTSIEIINDLGIQGLSIRELAEREGISEPAIYRHFGSKQEILLAVLARLYTPLENTEVKVHQENLPPKESILCFIEAHTSFIRNNRAITSVVFGDEIFRDDPVVKGKMVEIMKRKSMLLQEYISAGQSQGTIPDKFTSEELVDIVLGTLRRLARRWRMQDYSFDLSEKAYSVIERIIS